MDVQFVVPEVDLLESKAEIRHPVFFYDRTFRGILQAVGKDIPLPVKLRLAGLLDQAGVACTELAVPMMGMQQREHFKAVAGLGLRMKLAALARVRKEDVDAALECGADRIYSFMAVSDFHMENLLKASRPEVIEKSVEIVRYVKSAGKECEFTLRDAMRADRKFLAEVIEALVEAGVDVINFPDTTGILAPRTSQAFFRDMKELMPGTVASAHLHNDFGLGVANALAAIEGGAEQIHCALLGLGERCGMPPSEELALCLKQLYAKETGLDLAKLGEAGTLVAEACDLNPFPLKPIFGRNAYNYEVGTYMHTADSVAYQFEPYRSGLFSTSHASERKGV